MNTDRELMQQALEALEWCFSNTGFVDPDSTMKNLRERLAQPEQEPVAIYRAGQAPNENYHVQFFKHMTADEVLLYTAPPQRKPLTDEEIWNLAANCLDSVAGRLQFARAIEAAHGITGETQ